ncbi:MAG: UTP--glucose-phosphate uridylyltransferase [Chloroflexota bacterium]|nr:UTP--glucose-phosphate uridylyltransferase [Chloroflexota bacterium]
MKITKAVITAAGRSQRTLPLQTLIDRDGAAKSVLRIIVEEALSAGVEELCVIVCPGDEAAYQDAVGQHAGRLTFVQQTGPAGYAHAIRCAQEFVGRQPFLHLVGDHLYVSRGQASCAQQLVEVAQAEACAVSAVQASR